MTLPPPPTPFSILHPIADMIADFKLPEWFCKLIMAAGGHNFGFYCIFFSTRFYWLLLPNYFFSDNQRFLKSNLGFIKTKIKRFPAWQSLLRILISSKFQEFLLFFNISFPLFSMLTSLPLHSPPFRFDNNMLIEIFSHGKSIATLPPSVPYHGPSTSYIAAAVCKQAKYFSKTAAKLCDTQRIIKIYFRFVWVCVRNEQTNRDWMNEWNIR